MPSGERPCEPYTRHYYFLQCCTREAVQIALEMAVLHVLEVKAADILNAYVMAFNREKIWTVLNPEWDDVC